MDAEGEDADAADAPAAAKLVFNPARQHRTIIQRDSPHKQEAGRQACRPLQDMEKKGAGEAPLTFTKNGIIGMRVTVAALTCQSGTPAQRVQWSAAKWTARRDTRGTITTNMWLRDGTPARLKCAKYLPIPGTEYGE